MAVIISEEDFTRACEAFKNLNPELAGDAEAMRAKMLELEQEIKTMFAEWQAHPGKDDEYRPAIDILGQGRNFLACCVNVPQVDFLADREPAKQAEETPDPIATKHVAVYAAHRVLAAVMKQALGLIDDLRFMIYSDLRNLMAAIVGGEVCGVINISSDGQSRIESHLRHDLKTLPGWSYERAQNCVLPTCADFSPPHPLGTIIKTIREMQEGRFNQNHEQFFLEDALPMLLTHMRVPNYEIRVAVVDDQPEQIAGLEKVLAIWPRMKALSVIYPDMIAGPYDIVLLDEDLGDGMKGAKLREKLIQQEGLSEALFVSTSGGDKPAWAKHHFAAKSMVARSQGVALEFVKFMNGLIAEIGG